MRRAKQADASQIASEILNHLADAAGDLAYEVASHPRHYVSGDSKLSAELKRIRASGATDIAGSLADWFYNDPDFVCDMVGDRLFDETGGDRTLRGEVIEALKEQGHDAVKQAVRELAAR